MARRRKRTELTLREQCELLHGDGSWHIAGVPRLNIPAFEMHDGPLGLRYISEDQGLDLESEQTSICYPAPCLTACSFDVELMKRLGESIGEECLANQTNMVLAPGVNIKRNPLCGRNFEYLSEDPLLAGKMGAAFVKGVQSTHVGACLKHYACNSQESHRMINNSVVDERALHEIYLKPFEIVVKESNPWAVMAAYNKINGVYASDSDYLLKEVLRDDWKYEGVVMSDWGGTNDYVDSHNHGLDVEMPCLYKKRTNDLINAYRFRWLDSTALNESSDRVLNMLRKATLAPRHPKPFDYTKGHELAVEIGEKSMVLLKNDGILPMLNFDKTCVIGDLARTMRYQGAGSSQVKPYHLPSFIDAINEGREHPVPFAAGYFMDPNEDDTRAMMDAVDLASRSESAILFLGLPPEAEAEGLDRENMLLPEDQLRMLEAVGEVNENLIIVLCAGAPTELPFLSKCRALLLAYLGGEGASEAILHILQGKVSPSGHLAETWPVHLMDVPSFGFYPGSADFSLYKESIYVGYRYYLTADKAVNFPFGHGLSYAEFTQTLSLSAPSLKKDETVKAEVTVTNNSKIEASTLIQLYAEPKIGNVFKPHRTLIGFAKVCLKPGEKKVFSIVLNAATFAHYDMKSKSFKTESDSYLIQLGNSAADIIASVPLQVVAEEFESLQSSMPDYYSIPKDGFLLTEDSFEMLLGRPYPGQKDHRSRPYTLNSTMGDIRDTWIGKRILKKFEKMVGGPATDPALKATYAVYYGTPIRNIGMGGKKIASPNFALMVLSMANGKYIQALFHLAFGKTKGFKNT